MTQTTISFYEVEAGEFTGTLDDIDDGTTYGKVKNTALTNNEIDLAKSGVVGRVTATKISVYTVLLTNDPNFQCSAGTVSWDAHTLVYSGTNYSIASGSTGNKYIWWDQGASSYSSSNTKPDVLNDQTLHMIVINRQSGDDFWQVWKPTFIHGGGIVAETITGYEITADWITAKKFRTAISGARVEFDSSGIRGYDASTLQFEIKASDGKAWFAGGSSYIDQYGIHIVGQSLRIRDATYEVGRIYGDDGDVMITSSGSPNVIHIEASGSGGEIQLNGDVILWGAWHFDPYSSGQGYIGASDKKFQHVYALDFYGDVRYTDLRLQDMDCYKCGKAFEIGDELVFIVKGFDESLEGPEVLAVPIHRHCNLVKIKKGIRNLLRVKANAVHVD